MPTFRSVIAGSIAGAVVCVAVAAGLALGTGFLLFAFYLHLLAYVSATAAALATGVLAFAVAAFIAGVAFLAVRLALARGGSAGGGSKGASRGGRPGSDAALHAASGWISANPLAAGLGALCAGVILGLNPELRRALADGVSAWLRTVASDDGRRDRDG